MNILQSLFNKKTSNDQAFDNAIKADELFNEGRRLLANPETEKQAKQCYLKAAEIGHPYALYEIGLAHLTARLNPAELLKLFRLDMNILLLPKFEPNLTKGLKLLEQAGAAGCREAYYFLGRCYDDPDFFFFVEQDEEKAFDYYFRAAKMESPEALQKVGSFYLLGKGVKKDLKKALEFLEQAAQKGNADANAIMGSMCLPGSGLRKPDMGMAFFYFYRAALQGHAVAQFNVGQMFELGDGVEQNLRKRKTYYHLAAEQEHATAQYRLGMIYLGEGKKSEAFRWITKAAKQKLPDACVRLGDFFRTGTGTAVSRKAARKWYRTAIEHGNAEAEYCLWLMDAEKSVQGNNGDLQNTPESLKLLQASAEHGYGPAQNALGGFCQTGNGVPKDEQKAVEWYRKAADQGDDEAWLRLYHCYSDGIGVEKDDDQALTCLLNAADLNNADALFLVALCIQEDERDPENRQKAVGLIREAAALGQPDAIQTLKEDFTHDNPEDQYIMGQILSKTEPEEAVKWFRKAAAQGNAEAQYELSVSYERGIGVEQDMQSALEWLKKAAENGSPQAQWIFGEWNVYKRGPEADEALGGEYLKKAAEQGQVDAQSCLGMLFIQGNAGLPQDYAAAVHWLELAAKQDEPDAMNNLGNLYEQGLGVKQNHETAKIWYHKAAECGSFDAEENLATCAFADGDNETGIQYLRKAARHGSIYAKEKLKAINPSFH